MVVRSTKSSNASSFHWILSAVKFATHFVADEQNADSRLSIVTIRCLICGYELFSWDNCVKLRKEALKRNQECALVGVRQAFIYITVGGNISVQSVIGFPYPRVVVSTFLHHQESD